MTLQAPAAFDDHNQLHLGGMILVAKHGDIDIFVTGESSLVPTLRLQRADLDEIIQFLQRARKDRL